MRIGTFVYGCHVSLAVRLQKFTVQITMSTMSDHEHRTPSVDVPTLDVCGVQETKRQENKNAPQEKVKLVSLTRDPGFSQEVQSRI